MNWCYDYKEKIGDYWYFSNYNRLGASFIYKSIDKKGGKDIKEVFKGSISDCKEYLLKIKNNKTA